MLRVFLLAALTLTIIPTAARAEVPLLTPAELKADATHIVVGTVTGVFRDQTKTKNYLKTKGVVEIAVTEIEWDPNSKIEQGDAIYLRFWNSDWIGKGFPEPGASGHEVPAKGDLVRAYLTKGGGGYDVLLPNGMVVIKAAKKKAE